MLDIEIDGKQLQVQPGSTIMDAAQLAGAYIPHFCYHKKLSISANCRMCLVQVEKAPKPLPACATPVTGGMKVFTHSDLAVTAQKGVMEFLLINHPLDCPICDQGGECQLQDLAVGYGGNSSRYQEAKRVVFHKDVGPLISMQEMSRCIHCTRCVRFGQEIAGVMELGMANRNMHSEIQTFVGRTIDSELSGNMIDLCPVGALTSKPFRYSARSWELSRRMSVSPHDSLGSNLTVHVKNGRVMRVLPRENEDVNECWISDRDRFSYEALNSEERLLKPMIRVDGALKEVEWNVALDYLCHALNDISKTHSPESIAALAAPNSTLEELYLMKKLMTGLGSGNIDFRPRRRDFSADSKLKGAPWLGARLSDIKDLDSVLVVGSFLRKDHPLFAQRLRQLAKKGGQVSLVSIASETQLIDLNTQITIPPSDLAVALARIVNAVCKSKGLPLPDGVQTLEPCSKSVAIAESLSTGKRQAVFLGNVAEQHSQASQLHRLASLLADLVGGSFGFIGEAANSVGGYLAKATPTGLNAYDMFAQPRKAYVLFGVEPELDCHNPQLAMKALNQASLVVLMSPFKHQAAHAYADVLLPIAPFTETSGTFVSAEGRIQSFSGVVRPLGDTRPGWKVLRVIGNLLGLSGFDYESSEQIREEILPDAKTFAGGLNNAVDELQLALDTVTQKTGLQRVTPVPIYSSDLVVRRAVSLQQTKDAARPVVGMSRETMTEIGLSDGDGFVVRVSQDDGHTTLTLEADDCVPVGCVRILAGHASTAALGDMFGSISVERA